MVTQKAKFFKYFLSKIGLCEYFFTKVLPISGGFLCNILRFCLFLQPDLLRLGFFPGLFSENMEKDLTNGKDFYIISRALDD